MEEQPTQKDLLHLWKVCSEWRNQHKPSCAESIQQVDSINLSCWELAENVCEVIGYYE